MKTSWLKVSIAALAIAAISPAQAQSTWPTKQIRLIIPFPPGGQQEVASRILVDKVSADLGQSIIVESRPGADGNLGTEAVARSAPDGYTWLGSSVPFTTQVDLHPKSLRYNPQKDFAPVVEFGTTTFIFTVPAALPVNTVKEFVDYVNAHKGSISYAGSGRGSAVHLAGEKFKQDTGISMEMVPYTGQPPAITDLLAGRVQFMALGSVFAVPLIKSGKLKALAVLDTKRNKDLPDVPTIVEAGYPDLALASFFGIHVPAGTPKEIVDKINRSVVKAMQAPDLVQKFADNNVDPVLANTPEEFGAYIADQIKTWDGVIKAAHIETD